MRDLKNYNKNSKNKEFTTDKKEKQAEINQIKKDLINYAKTSWGKNWIYSILKIGRPYRMRRGIQYAKEEERINNLIIKKGQIFALVQGTAPTPYRVKVSFNIIPQDDWQKIIIELGSNLLNLMILLQGKLTEGIIEIFEKNNHSLFPEVSEVLNASCSCPDEAIPCKHIAATILYISKVLDYDPLILLKIRGKKKKELLKDLKIGKYHDISEKSIALKLEKEKIVEDFYSFNVPKISIQEFKNKKNFIENQDKITFHFRKPGKYIETLENLGLPDNLENPKEFAIVLEKIYKKITQEIYKISIKNA
ncbi:MAG: SWIM zinc finger family protein [Candidatus Lokiarchaeota archaeon]|nr:SWIM zinc finger family protein [Candidatus Lokiarchaeota archaeon]